MSAKGVKSPSSLVSVGRTLEEEVPNCFATRWAVLAIRVVSLLDSVEIRVQCNMIRSELVDQAGMTPFHVFYQALIFLWVKSGIDGAQPVSARRLIK